MKGRQIVGVDNVDLGTCVYQYLHRNGFKMVSSQESFYFCTISTSALHRNHESRVLVSVLHLKHLLDPHLAQLVLNTLEEEHHDTGLTLGACLGRSVSHFVLLTSQIF